MNQVVVFAVSPAFLKLYDLYINEISFFFEMGLPSGPSVTTPRLGDNK